MAKQLNVNLAVTANTQQAKQQLQQLQQTLSSLTTNSANLKIGLDQTQLQQASKQLLELQAHLKAATNVDTGALDFTKLNNSIRNSGKTLTQYGQQLLALGPQGKEAFAQLAQSVAQSEVPIRRLSGLLGQFGTVLKNTIRWQISSSLIHGFMGSIQQAYGYAQDLNKSLNNIQIVTGLSDNQMAKFAKTANTAAKALSTTTTKYTDAALIYYQQGIRNEKEIAERTNATIKMANVTGQSASQVSDQMTAIWNNFAKGGENLEYYADVITALGAATASSSEEISRGLEKFAAVADTVGLSYENATAALATITATTRQSADTVGTGLRTLFSRLQGLSLGQTLEDGVNLTKYSKALATVGVNALDAQGQLRNMDDILNDLGNKWQSLSKAQQVALAQTVGGVRQYTNLIALMDNFDFYQQNVDIAKNSEGTLQRQQAIYEKSWEASAKRVKAAAETIYSSLINDQFFIKLNDGFAGFLDILNNIITGLGGMKGLLLGIGGVMTNVFSGQIAQGMYNFGTGIKNMFRLPASQRAERETFITNAGNLMAGGKYDAATGKVSAPTDANKINLSSQYQTQLLAQSNLVKNEQFMTPLQKEAANIAMTNFNNARTQQQQIKQAYDIAIGKHQDALADFRAKHTAGILRTDMENDMRQVVDEHQQREKLINDVAASGYEHLSKENKESFAKMFNISEDYLSQNFDNAIQEARQQSKDTFIKQREDLVEGYSDTSIRNVINTLDNQRTLNTQRSAADARYTSAEQALKTASSQRSKGMMVAQGITNLASGVMSGIAVSTQWDQANKAIEQFKEGTLSTKDAVTQVTSSLAGMGMNGAMAFSSMTNALKAFGIQSTAALGWIGAILTAITIFAPKIITLFDKMHTTDAEIGEQLTAGVEQATNSAEEAKQAYDNLINGFNTHSSLLDTLNDLTEGTLEFKKALLEANDQAAKLIQDYDIDTSGWYYNNKGAIEFTAEAEKAMAEKYYKKQLQATAEKDAAILAERTWKRNQTIQKALEITNNYLTKAGSALMSDYAMYQLAGSESMFKAEKTQQYLNKPGYKELLEYWDNRGRETYADRYLPYWFEKMWNAKEDENEAQYNAQNPNKLNLFNWFASTYADLQLQRPDLDWATKQRIVETSFNSQWLNQSNLVGEGKLYSSFADAYNAYITEAFNPWIHTEEGQSGALITPEYLQERFSVPKYERNKIPTNITLDSLYDLFAEHPEWVETYGDSSIFAKITSARNLIQMAEQYANDQWVSGKAASDKMPYLRDENGNIVVDKKGNPVLNPNAIQWSEIFKNNSDIDYSVFGFTDTGKQTAAEQMAAVLQAAMENPDYKLTTSEGLTQFLIDRAATVQQDISQNKLALTDARMASTGQILSASENFVADVLSKNTQAIQQIEEQNKYLKDENGNLVTYNDKLIDLTQQTTDESLLSLLAPPALVKEIQESDEYKNEQDQSKKDQIIRNAILRKQIAPALTEAFEVAYKAAYEREEIPENTKDLLDNWQNLTLTQFSTALTAAFGATDATALLEQYAGPILEKFTTAAGKANWDLSKWKEKLGNVILSDIETAATLPASFSTLYGEQVGKTVADKIWTPLLEGDTTILKAFEQFQSTGSTITDLANIKAGTTSLGKYAKGTLASDIYNSILSEAGEKGLFEELYNSEDFAEGLKSLRKELKKTGTIGADSLVALADQSELLSNYLEISGTNAQGLADALNLLETGQIDNVSNALLRALSAAGAVNSNLAQTYAYIDNFKEERSVEDIGAFMKKRADTVKQGFTSGMLLDAPVLQSMEALFGSDMRATYQQDIYKWTGDQDEYKNLTPEQISKLVNDKYADQIAAMQSIQERGNLSGMFEYYEKQGVKEGGTSMFSYNKQTGQVTAIDRKQLIENGWQSQDEFIKGLQENYGMSETMARAMASEYAATNGNIAQLWRETAAEKGITALTATVDENGNKLNNEILTDDQARAFYKQYKDVIDQMYGYDSKTGEESFLEKIAKDAEAAGKEFIDLGKDFDIATASFEELQNRYEAKKGKGSFKDYLGLPKDGGVVTDLNAVKQQLLDLGMTSAKANTEIDKLINSGEIKLFNDDDINETTGEYIKDEFATFRAENQEIKSMTEAWEAFQQKKQEAAKQDEARIQQQELITNAIKDAAKALGEEGIDIPLNPVTDAIDGYIDKIGFKTVILNYKDGPGAPKASGYNNAGFAGGKHSNGQYEGLAEVGELGPELFIHDGQPYLAGIHGRTKAYVHPNDQIYTAAQTKKILRDNPSLQDIPAFSVGYNQVSWGDSSNANADNAKTSKWEPERYHLITRQIKDLQREYERLSKIKDNAYGTNKLEAIQKEIDATNQLIEGQKRLVKEAEDYLKIDTDRVTKLLKPGEFQLDANGNLANFEELQQKYRKAAEEKKDKKAEEIWKALMQYEETLDKLHEADEQMRELIYQQMELRLETITTKVDLKINFDEREIKLIDHYIGKIDDNIYDTAQVLAKTGDKLAYISKKIDDTKEGLAGLFKELSDSEGNLIRKEDGSAYTLEEWLALSEAERDALNINGKFGEQLEEYMDNILEYIEELEEFKTKGVEEFGEAFEQLNNNVRESIDLFDHYNSLMETLKNIVSLQGAKISPELQALMKNIDALMFQNTQNNLQAEQQNYERLKSNVEDLKQKIANTTDETLKRAWEEQLKTAENEMRTSQQNLYQLWETGLQQAKDRFDTSLDEAVQNYERKLSGIYGTIDDLQKAWSRKNRNNEFYEQDFEKYYQINKLQRTINSDLANQLKNGFKQSEGLKKLYKDLNDARADGVQLTAYDLDIYQKRYEYEKALMDLEDSRNAKTQVRLQRDANGNWGYVYTSNIDEDELLKKEQAVEDAFYERQKATQDRLSSLSNDIMSEIGDIATTIQGMRSRGADEEAIQDYLKDIQGWLNNYKQGLATALHDADITEEEARQRYGAEGFDIIGTFGETLLSAIMGDMGDLDTFFATIQSAMEGTNEEMQGAATEYQQAIIDMNKWFDAQGENFIGAMTEFASAVAGDSNTTLQHLIGEEGIINDAKNTFSDILKAAEEFEKKFLEIYQPIIDANEQLVADLLKALDALNRHEYKQDTSDTTGSGDTGTGGTGSSGTGGTGSSGTGGTSDSGSGSGDSEDKVEYVYDYKPYNSEQHEVLRRKKHSNGKWVHDSYQAHSFVQISAGPSSIKIEKCSKCGYTKTTEVSRSYATGGLVDYTGPAWVDGTKSHPESFLNATDTKNILDTAYILRTLNLQAMLAGQGFGKLLLPTMSGLTNSILDQNVTITASFPNATNHSEIEEAFTNLINKASQYANRKGY